MNFQYEEASLKSTLKKKKKTNKILLSFFVKQDVRVLGQTW